MRRVRIASCCALLLFVLFSIYPAPAITLCAELERIQPGTAVQPSFRKEFVEKSEKLLALLSSFTNEFRASQYQTGLEHLEEAVNLFECNTSSRMRRALYGDFLLDDIDLNTTGLESQVVSLLWKVAILRADLGFVDPLTPRKIQGSCAVLVLNPLEFLEKKLGRQAVIDKLLPDAIERNDSQSVVYILSRSPALDTLSEANLEVLQKIDHWREKEKRTDLYALGLLKTAQCAASLGHVDTARSKWKSAIHILRVGATVEHQDVGFQSSFVREARVLANRFRRGGFGVENSLVLTELNNVLADPKERKLIDGTLCRRPGRGVRSSKATVTSPQTVR